MNKQSPQDFIHIATGIADEASSFDSKEFDRMEEKISMVEDLLDQWKDAVMLPKNLYDKEFMVRAFSEMAVLSQLIDRLYAQWIQMDEEQGEEHKEPKRVKNQIIC